METEAEINTKISIEASGVQSQIDRIKLIAPQKMAIETQGNRFDEGFTSEEADLFALWDTSEPPINERALSTALLCTNIGLRGFVDGEMEMAIGMLTEAHQYIGMLQGHDQQKIISEIERKASRLSRDSFQKQWVTSDPFSAFSWQRKYAHFNHQP